MSNEQYGVLETGNITNVNMSTGASLDTLSSSEMEYDSANRLIKFNGEDVIYDADGNMIYGPLGGSFVEFEYDCRNRLIRAGTTTYEYDAENNRIATVLNGIKTSYVVDTIAPLSRILSSETDGIITYYVYGFGLISQEKDSIWLFYHFNNIGSTEAVTDTSGNIVEKFQYGPYGELTFGSNYGIIFLYNGEYGVATDASGLLYMRARYYNPEIKRFINEDPIGDGTNWYAYANGNPINLIDPFGLCSQTTNWGPLKPIMESWKNRIKEMHNMGGGWDIFASYSEGIMGTVGSQIYGIGDLVTNPFGTISKAISSFADDPLRNNPVYGVYSFYSGVAKASGDGDWNSVAYSLGQFTVVLPQVAVALEQTPLGKVEIGAKPKVTAVESQPISYCFVAGTLVTTDNGFVAIEEIQVGDKVLAMDYQTGEVAVKEVVQTFVNETTELVHVTANGEVISATPSHPFYVTQFGWTLAKDLRAGDVLVLTNGEYVVVEAVQHEILENPIFVYNFEVEDFHTYFVGVTGVLVHNDCPTDYLNKAKEPMTNPSSNVNARLKDTDYKAKWTENGYKYEVRIHEGNPRYTNADNIYRVERQRFPSDPIYGSGKEYLGTDGKWYHTSVLKEFNKDGTLNPIYNDYAARVTHIPY